MKNYILRFKFLMILMMVMNVVDVQGQELPISDAQHSGCMRVSIRLRRRGGGKADTDNHTRKGGQYPLGASTEFYQQLCYTRL